MYIYPDNLKSKAVLWLWELRDIAINIVFDNQDGKSPIEYAEVIVTRKLYRNGESGYFINKTPFRLKDVLELFMDTGIGKYGYSIIGQGKIDVV